MSGDEAGRAPPPTPPAEQPPDEKSGVRVSRDAPGAEGSTGRKPSKLAFRLQAQRREKWDDPVFDNVRVPREKAPEPPPDATEAAASSTDQSEPDAGGEGMQSEEQPSGVLDRVARFFRRSDTNRST